MKVEPNVISILEEVGSSLDEEYENIKMELEVNGESDDEKSEELDNTKKKKKKSYSKIKEMNVAIAKNSRRLVEKVSEAQKLNMGKVKCQGVIDTGQGSLKICVSIFDEDIDPKICFSDQETQGEKLTGVNRLIILAEVEQVKETHYNLRHLLEKIHLEQLPGLVLVSDLSATNAYLGLSSHGGKFACYVCEGVATI